PAAEIGDLLFDVGNRHLIGIAQNGNDQTAWAADGNTDVEVAMIDDVFSVYRSVDDRVLLERRHGSLHEEGREAQLDAVLFLELVFVLLAQIENALHVDFVESRKNGIVGLRLQKALGNAG